MTGTAAGGVDHGGVDYVVTFLAMATRPDYPRPQLPPGAPAALISAAAPPAWYLRALYDAVGSAYHWTDLHARPEAEVTAFLADPQVTLTTLLRDGWPHGFFLLDGRAAGVCNLAYLGLVPEAVGRGLGRFLLESAVHAAWDQAGVTRVTVNTCSLDHPRALPLYQSAGFAPVRREAHRRLIAPSA